MSHRPRVTRRYAQAVFSALFYFAPIALYNGVLVAGYATIFTTGPVFSLVLDEVRPPPPTLARFHRMKIG